MVLNVERDPRPRRWDQEHYASYVREEANREISRLANLLRDLPTMGRDRGVALAILEFLEDAGITGWTPKLRPVPKLDQMRA